MDTVPAAKRAPSLRRRCRFSRFTASAVFNSHPCNPDTFVSAIQQRRCRSPSKRGTGTQFGPDVTENFLETNGLELLIRSHEVKENGYEVMHDGKCITIFSAPNYCDQIGNKGAFITLKEDCKPEFTMFDAVPHPAIKPMAYAAGYGSMFGF